MLERDPEAGDQFEPAVKQLDHRVGHGRRQEDAEAVVARKVVSTGNVLTAAAIIGIAIGWVLSLVGWKMTDVRQSDLAAVTGRVTLVENRMDTLSIRLDAAGQERGQMILLLRASIKLQCATVSLRRDIRMVGLPCDSILGTDWRR